MRTPLIVLVALLAALPACAPVGTPQEAQQIESPTTTASVPTPPTPPAPAPPAPPASAPPAPPVSAPPVSAPPAPPASAPSSSGTPAQGAGERELLGSWKSSACPPRKYERQLTFAKDGTFSAADLVSPCPPKVTCVWSGIIQRKGTFKRSGNTVSLAVSDASTGPGGQPFPTSLSIDAKGALVETGEGGKPCHYTR
jgi:hypothetical protein